MAKTDPNLYKRNYYYRNREKLIQYQKEYYRKNREERLAYQKEYNKKLLEDLSPEEIKEFYKIQNYISRKN